MTYQIIIIDDRSADILHLRTLTGQWAAMRQITPEIISYSSAEEFLFHCGDHVTCDLILLDIEMPGIDGVTLAKTIRRTNKNVNIVFITGYSDYISEGYEVSALHYLVKPVDREKFIRTLDRAYENALRYMQYLTLKLPVLSGANALGGAVVGLVEGVLALFITVWFLRRFGVSFDTAWAADTMLLRFFTTNTPLGVLALT